ncbi:hypothetical protein HAX54_015677 [Datura stramonium]|uniref:Uncharacterized protein n=1 Tax=Datura stramonium TaxID=4076 RepID=A0ABS8TTM6_DATST|nr:hypothetical protein [Datura stramonium]
MNNRAYKAQEKISIRRTVYVSEIDNNVTEEQLAALFSMDSASSKKFYIHTPVQLFIVGPKICHEVLNVWEGIDPAAFLGNVVRRLLTAESAVIHIPVFVLLLWSSLMSSEDEREINVEQYIVQILIRGFSSEAFGGSCALNRIAFLLVCNVRFVIFGGDAESAILALDFIAVNIGIPTHELDRSFLYESLAGWQFSLSSLDAARYMFPVNHSALGKTFLHCLG